MACRVLKQKCVTQTFPDGVSSYLFEFLLVAVTKCQTEQLKEERAYLAHSLRVRKSWQQECEASAHIAVTGRQQREMSASICIYSETVACGMMPSTSREGLLTSVTPLWNALTHMPRGVSVR